MTVKKAIDNASASLEMEGLHVSDALKSLLLQKLNHEISMEEYIRIAMELKEVKIF